MKTSYIKQTLYDLRRRPVAAWVSVLGTALAIFLIMVVVMLQEVNVSEFSPESNRSRFLHATFMSYGDLDDNWDSNTCMSQLLAREYFKGLETAEAVSIYCRHNNRVSVGVRQKTPISVDEKDVDADFFKVFDFDFISGNPIDSASYEAGLPLAVISADISRHLFGTTDAAGKEFMINNTPYTVKGVVKDVSRLATYAYAQVWVSASSTELFRGETGNSIDGFYSVVILAKSRDDFDDICQECDRRLADINKQIKEAGLVIKSRNRPYDQEKNAIAFGANYEPDVKAERRMRWIVYLILLIVPAINLSSMTQSRLRERVAENAVRRAFGCHRSTMVMSLLSENLVVTLLAGLLGLIMSVVFACLGTDFLFAQPYAQTFTSITVSPGMLLHWSTFLTALGFCFILNILSTTIPAWRASRAVIVDSLRGNNR